GSRACLRMRCDRCNRSRRRRHVCWSRRLPDFCRSFRRRRHLRLNLGTYLVTSLLFLIRKKTCAQRQDAESLFHQPLDVASAAGQCKPTVIPTEVEGSRRVSFKVTSTDPSTSLAMTGT